MMPSGKARLAGVIGDPVSHSLSPRLHGFWLEALRIDGAYVPLHVSRENFAVALRGLRSAGFQGVNVTVPHKEAAFAIADNLDQAARATGAVNLLVFEGASIKGCNTDVEGLAQSLVAALGRDALRNRPAAVLGAGGAARAAILALARQGVSEVRVVARNPERANMLAKTLSKTLSGSVAIRCVAWADWRTAAPDLGLLLNATSAGMRGQPALDISLQPLHSTTAVCDIVYNPLETELLKAARARGLKTVDGLGMLMHQAAPSFEAFYGVKPEVTVALRTHLEGALVG